MRGRFAPSPTGELHVGSVSTALLAWLQVRQAGGTFVLRIEDLDRPRVVPGMAHAQAAALQALGLTWDEGPDLGGPFGPYVQSARAERYAEALRSLQAQGLLYPCYCSRAELQRAGGGGELQGGESEDGPRYPGTCRTLTAAERVRREREGRTPALRFRVRPGIVRFTDGLCGPQAQDVQREVGDFVVLRRDGIVAYQLAVVVDDLAMHIDHVLRGADLLRSTARQLLLCEALGGVPPLHTHVPLWLGPDGAKLSKRHGKVGIQSQLAAGRSAGDVLEALARALWGHPAGRTPTALLSTVNLAQLDPAPRVWTG